MTTTLPTSARPTGRKPVDRQELSTRLLGSAATKSYDPVVDIDWDAPAPEGLYGLSPEWSSLYGTPMWDELTEDQHITLTTHEMCKHRTFIATVAAISADNLVQPEVYATVGLDPASARAAARANEHYRAKLCAAAGGPTELLRKRAGLL